MNFNLQPNFNKKQPKSGGLLPVENYKMLVKRRKKKMNNKFSENLKKIRKDNNLTQKDIKTVIGECPFSDEYYMFNSNCFNKHHVGLETFPP